MQSSKIYKSGIEVKIGKFVTFGKTNLELKFVCSIDLCLILIYATQQMLYIFLDLCSRDKFARRMDSEWILLKTCTRFEPLAASFLFHLKLSSIPFLEDISSLFN